MGEPLGNDSQVTRMPIRGFPKDTLPIPILMNLYLIFHYFGPFLPTFKTVLFSKLDHKKSLGTKCKKS